MDWTAVTIAKSGHAYYKSIPYCLKPSGLVPQASAGIWLRETADPEALAEPDG